MPHHLAGRAATFADHVRAVTWLLPYKDHVRRTIVTQSSAHVPVGSQWQARGWAGIAGEEHEHLLGPGGSSVDSTGRRFAVDEFESAAVSPSGPATSCPVLPISHHSIYCCARNAACRLVYEPNGMSTCMRKPPKQLRSGQKSADSRDGMLCPCTAEFNQFSRDGLAIALIQELLLSSVTGAACSTSPVA